MARPKITKPCAISECPGRYYSSDMCQPHYGAARRSRESEKIAAYKRQWYANNRERLGYKERQKPKSKEYFVAYKKAWADKNRERINARHREWERSWYAENTTKALLKVHARQTKTSVKISPESISNWYTRICGICNFPITEGAKIDIDHKVPLSRGGLHVVSNLQLAHRFCNRSKGSKLL